MKLLRRILIGVAALLLAGYLGILGVLYFWQRDLQYDRSGRLFDLSETALTSASLVRIPTSGGNQVTGWYQPPPDPTKPVILFYRGNAQSFSREHRRFAQWVSDGYGFLAFDYRGFPGSPGELSEENVLADAEAAYDWLAETGVRIVIWARSLGSAPGTYVASRRDAEALILETPFISAVAVAADRYGFLPVGWLMHDQFRLNDWLPDVAEPVFVAHGTADETIGVHHGEWVFENAPNAVELWIEPGGTHGDLWDRGLWARAKAFIESVDAPGRQ